MPPPAALITPTTILPAGPAEGGRTVSRWWDVVISGAGPAGSRAAELFAARGARVLFLDPRAPWEKPCGGGLTAAALRNTPELYEVTATGAAVREILAMAPCGASVVVPLRQPFAVVSRRTLSEWGLERAQKAGALFRRAGIESALELSDGWEVTDTAGKVHRARWLIAADGAASRLRRQLAPRLRPELAPTRVGYPTKGVPCGRAVFYFLPVAEGYVWDFPRPDHHSVGIGVAPGTYRRDALDGALQQYQAAETGISGAVLRHGAAIATAKWASGRFADLAGFRFALLGDAAGLANPLTGEGIDYALRSAKLAVETFDDALGFSLYPDAVRRAFKREIARALLIRRWLYRPGVADRLIVGARRSPRAALLLMALADAINEHGSLRSAVLRALSGDAPDQEATRAACDCPDGRNGCAPSSEAGKESGSDQLTLQR
ncbi:MAG: geranylgeranyl reductase [Gemmatimonadales bacterium]|nr:MAG: geranylgeranyl reductase [Gemmatimonadales bacterium]